MGENQILHYFLHFWHTFLYQVLNLHQRHLCSYRLLWFKRQNSISEKQSILNAQLTLRTSIYVYGRQFKSNNLDSVRTENMGLYLFLVDTHFTQRKKSVQKKTTYIISTIICSISSNFTNL